MCAQCIYGLEHPTPETCLDCSKELSWEEAGREHAYCSCCAPRHCCKSCGREGEDTWPGGLCVHCDMFYEEI